MQQNPPVNLLDPNLLQSIQQLSNKPLPLYVHQTNGYKSACIEILISKDWLWVDGSRAIFTLWNDMEPNNSGGEEDYGRVMSIERRRKCNERLCAYSQLYLCEMRAKPEETVVGAHAVSLQRFSLKVFKFVADHSFAFVHRQVIVCNATTPGSRCTKKCSSSDWRNSTLVDDEHRPYHSLIRLARQKERLLWF